MKKFKQELFIIMLIILIVYVFLTTITRVNAIKAKTTIDRIEGEQTKYAITETAIKRNNRKVLIESEVPLSKLYDGYTVGEGQRLPSKTIKVRLDKVLYKFNKKVFYVIDENNNTWIIPEDKVLHSTVEWSLDYYIAIIDNNTFSTEDDIILALF